MKWKNKGHEFDKVFENISQKESFYLFGAGDYGRQFVDLFSEIIKINGFLDNDENKIRDGVEGYSCIKPSAVKLDKKEGIVLTISQFMRPSAINQLEGMGYIRNIDYFIIEEFMSVFSVYVLDKVYFTNVSFLPSTACNLNCKHCLNFNPYAKSVYVREYDRLIEDVDLFFNCVDKVMLFHLSGGEPMLYSRIADLIRYIDRNYSDKIYTFRTVTNGTVIPKEDTLRSLAESNIEVTVDDYRDAIPEKANIFNKLIRKLDEYGIKYYTNKAEYWIDLAPDSTDYSWMSEDELIRHRDNCGQAWQELRDGKLFNCNYASYAAVAGLTDQPEEYYDLRSYTKDKKKELIEFRLGYTDRGYTEFCKKCRGFMLDNPSKERPAEQV